jgi:hypothetical protein
MYLYFRIFFVHRSFPGFSLLRIGFLGQTMGLRDSLAEAIVFRVGFLWNFVECRGRDTTIGFGVSVGLRRCGEYSRRRGRWLR